MGPAELVEGKRYDVRVAGCHCVGGSTWVRAVFVGTIEHPPEYAFRALDFEDHPIVTVAIARAEQDVRPP